MAELESSEARLPHRGPARLVERVLAREDAHLEALARVPIASPFRASRSGRARVPAVLALEMAAQAAAAFESSTPARVSRRQHGLLVALRDVHLHASELDADADFLVRVELDESAEALHQWSFAVRCEGSLVAEGILLTYEALSSRT